MKLYRKMVEMKQDHQPHDLKYKNRILLWEKVGRMKIAENRKEINTGTSN